MQQIEVIINGEARRVPEGQTVTELLEFFKLDPSRVALEFDGSILKPAEWATKRVQPGARLEIVHFVGGG